MNISIVTDKSENWVESRLGETEVFSKGILWIDKKCYQGEEANAKLAEFFGAPIEKDNLKEKINGILGHFAFMVKTRNMTIAVVDKVRSIPIYYSATAESIIVSNNANEIVRNLPSIEKNEPSKLILEMAGYTIGAETLISGLNQLTAGKYVIYDQEEKAFHCKSYFRYWPKQFFEIGEDELIEKLHSATLTTFNKMVESLDGRPVFLPLSGGYDSRLILAMLKELKYDNFVTFTYGVPGVWEIERAKFVAEKARVKWHYIRYKPSQIRDHFHSSDRQKYFSTKAGFSSVPSLTPYFSIKELERLKLISEDAVIINGQSGDFTSGGHIPKIVEDDNYRLKLTDEMLIDQIIKKHFSLWENLKSPENITLVSAKIRNNIGLKSGQLTPEEFAQYWELHEWEERQSKFVVNGQRSYDWSGYDWRLPLWSDELMEYWIKVPWHTKIGQKLFFKYLKKYDFQGLFNMPMPPQFSYFPVWAKAIKPVFHVISKMTGKKKADYYQKYLKYFMTYAPFYPQRSYFDYLRDSKSHRSAVSYWTKDYLENTIDF